jgi:hypothetical protein
MHNEHMLYSAIAAGISQLPLQRRSPMIVGCCRNVCQTELYVKTQAAIEGNLKHSAGCQM